MKKLTIFIAIALCILSVTIQANSQPAGLRKMTFTVVNCYLDREHLQAEADAKRADIARNAYATGEIVWSTFSSVPGGEGICTQYSIDYWI